MSDWASALWDGATDLGTNIAETAAEGFKTASGYATGAFDWMNRNPAAANVLGGVAVGMGQAYLANQRAADDREFQREMYERSREDSMITPADVSNYGSYAEGLSRGLISDGMISGSRRGR